MLAARKVGAPLKWVEDRRENLLAAGQSRHEHADVRMAFDGDGAIQAADIDFVSDCGAYPTPWPVGTAAAVGVLFPGPYRVPRASFTAKPIYTNTVGRAAYRGPWQFESLAREVLLDIAARQMGMDPVELRRRNLLRRDELPYANPNGMTYDSISPLETFEQALAMLDYEAFRAEQAEARTRRPLPRRGRLELRRAVDARASVPTRPRRRRSASSPRARSTCTSPAARPGTASRPRSSSSPPTRSASTIDDVDTIQGDTAVTGFGAGAAGSRSGSMTAGAVRETASILRDRICRHRRPQARSRRRRHRARRQPRERARHAVDRHLVRRARGARVLRSRARCRPACRPGWRRVRGTRADAPLDLGERDPRVHLRGRRRHRSGVTLLRYIVSEDCGPMINPNVVEGQIAGGVVQGIGGVLYEHLAYDDDGNPRRHHVHGLPPADRGRGAHDRVRARRDAEPGPGRVQGRGRRRRDRRAAGGGERGRRRARAVRRDA